METARRRWKADSTQSDRGPAATFAVDAAEDGIRRAAVDLVSRILARFSEGSSTGARAAGRGIVSPKFVELLLTEHESGRRDNYHWLWLLLMLELWLREFEDVKPQGLGAGRVRREFLFDRGSSS